MKNVGKTESSRQIWQRQLKTIGHELLKLLQKYAQSMNERQSSFQNTQKTPIFDYENNDAYDARRPLSRKSKRKRRRENYEDPWIKAWNNDSELLNYMFGFDEFTEAQRYYHKNGEKTA